MEERVTMGFFSDLKEDLTQAVNELLPEEEAAAAVQAAEGTDAPEQVLDETSEQSVGGLSLEEMLANIDSVQLPEDDAEEPTVPQMTEPEPETSELVETEPTEPETLEPEAMEAMTPEPTSEAEEPVLPEPAEPEETESPEPLDEILAETTEPAAENTDSYHSHKGAEKMEINTETEQDRMVTDETAVITEGMQITGDMTSTGSLDVIGSVTGNIEILGKLNITGHITGNSRASEVYAEGAKIDGEIVSEGAVKIGEASVIIGNITATYAVIAGAVKGDIDVHGPVLLDSTAIVMGNIRSKSVQINNGAVIEGMCSQCYADVSPTHFFDDYQPKAGKSKNSKNN